MSDYLYREVILWLVTWGAPPCPHQGPPTCPYMDMMQNSFGCGLRCRPLRPHNAQGPATSIRGPGASPWLTAHKVPPAHRLAGSVKVVPLL